MSELDRDDLTVDAASRRSSGDVAARHIKRLIFEGRLRAGDRVPQDEVAQALGISRIPVREGLIALEREGWITSEMHRGAFVNGLDEQAVRDHYELFGLVYGYGARQAIARGASTGELVEQLTQLNGELADADDPRDVQRLAVRFHQVVIEATRSPRIAVLMGAMSGLVPGNFFALVPGSIAVQKQGLTAIARAVRKGNGETAAREYERMMRRHGDLVVELLESRGFFAVNDG